MKNTLKDTKMVILLISVLCLFSFNNQISYLKSNSQTNDKIILMYGNSLTHQGNWEEILTRKDVINGGTSGYTTQQLSWTIAGFLKQLVFWT